MSESSTSGFSLSESELAAQMVAHDRLVCWVVRRQRLGSLSFAEARHAGRIGLWHALQSYDPTRGTCFSSYAVPAIARAVWDEVAAQSAPVRAEAELARWVEETDPSEALHQVQVRTTLHALVALLAPRLRAVVIAHHGLDGTPPQTFAEIGQTWGVSRQRIHQLHRQALLLLAHPATSGGLRALVDRQRRSDYQRTLARQHHAARVARRGTQRVPR